MSQDSENWSVLQELFHLAESTPQEDRVRVLAEHCPDQRLVQRALEILRSSTELEADPPPSSPQPGIAGRVGPYTLIRLLGSGGIGTVYLAERIFGGAPQRVALKMLAPHAAGPSFVERFHREQHILGSLDHPHITRMMDAGLTETGQPYLVMEYVDGEHLDAYCDARKLGIAERLRLFLQVCEAVEYAHRNLIVHLDLKPSNILVTADGMVKLLDFGTSKLIQTDAALTTTVLVTPAYASPEQLRNEAVTTLCDVYSLGAVLAELLAGKRSGRRTSAAMLIEQAFSRQEPERVENCVTPEAAPLRGTSEAKLRQALKGDLSVIVAKCQRADPRDRYRSVEALTEDLRRYLSGRPVLATPQTALYRVGKFVRRNRKAIAVIAAAVVVLAVSLTYAAVRQQQALREARRSVRMQAFMTQLFRLANTNYMGKPAATVPELLKLGSIVLPQMIRNPADQRAAEISLAESMFDDADFKDAEALLDRAIVDAKVAHDVPAEAEAEAYGGMVAYKLGKIGKFQALSSHALQLADKQGVTPAVRVWIKTFYTQNRYELGQTTREDVALQREAVKEAHDPTVPPNELAYASLNLALTGSNNAPLAEQQKLAEEAVAIYRSEPYSICERAAAEQVLGFFQNQSGQLQASVQTYRDSYNSYKTCQGEESHDTLLAAAYLGLSLMSAGQNQEAISVFEPTIEKMDKVIGPDHLELLPPLSGLGRAYLAEGQYGKAAEVSARLFHIMNGKVNPNSSQMGIVHLTWARALAGENQDAEALEQAKLADSAYTNEGATLAGSIVNAKRAHQLVLDLQAKLNKSHKRR